jgi:hypothetical protein
VNQEIREQWVAALRSGEYEQGQGALNSDGKFCCLGVLCELAVNAGVTTRAYNDNGETVWASYGPCFEAHILPYDVRQWAALDSGDPGVRLGDGDFPTLAELNDGDHDYPQYSFAQIADLIEDQL